MTEAHEQLAVYIFIFSHPKGCQSIDTEYHRALLPCEDKLLTDSQLLGYKCSAGCGAATLWLPVKEWLAESPQYRVILSPPKLDGYEVIETCDKLEKSLIADMGGHGRALELQK